MGRARLLLVTALVLCLGGALVPLACGVPAGCASSLPPGQPTQAGMCDVAARGAVGDNKTMNTQVIQETIAACHDAFPLHCTVRFPAPGRFLTGSVNITSNTTILVASGATIVGSPNAADYPRVQPVYGPDLMYAGLLSSYDTENVAIVGEALADSVVDGSGWWGGWYMNRRQRKGYERGPRLLQLINVTGVEVAQLAMRDGARWHVHPVRCRNVHVHDISITAPRTVGGTDGVDPDSSVNVLVERARIDTGDDAISIKAAGPGPAANIVVRDVYLLSRNFAVGAHTIGGIRNVTLQDSRIGDALGSSAWAIKFKTSADGGLTRDVLLQRLQVGNISVQPEYGPGSGFFLDMSEVYSASGEEVVSTGPPPPGGGLLFENVTIRDVAALAVVHPGGIHGSQDAPISTLRLRNITLPCGRDCSWTCGFVHGLEAVDVQPPLPADCSGGGTRRVAAATRVAINASRIGAAFDGHGGLSAGATSRLVIDYPAKQRDEILDYLFLPGFGASLAVVKVEIGGDTQSTDGTEPSHMHFRGDLGCRRGYEGWLAAEARKRNPAVKVWSLAWGVPGWVGNHSYFSPDNIDYQIGWLKCLRDEWGVQSDYLGLWNERPQGSVSYVVDLRRALDKAGFQNVGITVEATWQPLINQVLVNSTFNSSVAAATIHYGCNRTVPSALQAHKKVWAGEETPTNTGNWTGASCWGRKLNQHYILMNATSVIAWAVLWAAPASASMKFEGNAFLNASEPWSGHYDIFPVLWMNAHWHQFSAPGWHFLPIGPAGGADLLPNGGGSYVTLVDSADGGQVRDFSIIVESLDGSCGQQGNCNVAPITATQALEFALDARLAAAAAGSGQTLQVWCSNASMQFVHVGAVQASSSGVVSFSLAPDTICTLTTLAKGTKGAYPPPPAAARFPTSFHQDFDSTAEDALAPYFADVYGSFAVRNKALTQVATDVPDGWAPVNYDPLTFIGDSHWRSVNVSVDAFVNHTAASHYVRLCSGGCDTTGGRVIHYDCAEACCLNVSWTGNWTLGAGQAPAQGRIPNFRDAGYHRLALARSSSGTLTAWVNGTLLASVPGSCTVPGSLGLGCGKYHYCSFDNFALSADEGEGDRRIRPGH